MTEDLQALIDRLQREAVDEGQGRARTIVEEAEAKAAALVREAGAKAERFLERAQHDAEAFTERSTFALEQAGRDLIIAVSQAVERLLAGLVHESLMEELRPGLLAEMLAKMADAYATRSGRERRMDVLLGDDDLEEVARLYAQRYQDRVREGVELKLDNSVVKGFRIRMVEEHIEHDFTIEAIAEALTHHLRPHLARILPREAPKALRPHGSSGDAPEANGAAGESDAAQEPR